MSVLDIFKKHLSGEGRSAVVKRNILGSILIKGLSILVSLILVPMTLGYLSSELYGVWLTLSSIVVWLGFFDIGFTQGLRNRLAEALALNDTERGKALVSTTYAIMVLIFIPLMLLIWCAIPWVDWCSLLRVSPQYEGEIRQALYVLGACFSLHMIIGVFSSVVAAYQKVALSSSFTVMGNIISLVIIYILTKTIPASLTYMALTLSLMPIVVTLVASIFLYSTKFRAVSPSLKSADKKYVRQLFGLGVKFFLINIQVVILFQTTNILISNISGPNDVTSYNIAYKYINIALMLYNIILTPLWPAFTDAYTKKDFSWMNSIYKKMMKVWALSSLIIILMAVASPVAYKLWIGNKAVIPFAMTALVSIYTIIHSFFHLPITLINGIGCVKLQTYVTILGLICHIPLSYFLGQFVGGYGVLLSMIIIVSIYSVCFTVQIKKILNHTAEGIWLE